jgi:oxidase EvaA
MADLTDLLALRSEVGESLTTELVEFPHDSWEVRGGRIANRRTDFFSVIAQRDEVGVERILFRQPEPALVGLLTAQVDGERLVLLNARSEPGLHGGCQFSTTVQSTPSNYERRHGGAATPFIDVFLAPEIAGRVLHDSMQYDWGQYYDAKVKRFLIVEVEAPPPVVPPLVWVAEATLRRLLREDFAVTGDLRAAAFALSSAGAPPAAGGEAPADAATVVDVDLAELENWRMHETGIDEIEPRQGVAIRYVRAHAPTREVAEWSQPLMLVADPLEIRLPVRATTDGIACAVQLRTQPGLRGTRLWFPAGEPGPSTAPASTVRVSAEGGRFLRHEVRVSQVADELGAGDDGVRWVDLPTLRRWAVSDRVTSLELRLALASLDESGVLR